MILDIAKLFWDEKTKKVKKGRALLFPTGCLLVFLSYLGAVEAYAMGKEYIAETEGKQKKLEDKVTTVEGKVTELEGKVDDKVPLTVEEVEQQLQQFKGEQIQLYNSQLESQNKLFEMQAKNMKDGVKDVVDIVLKDQQSIQDSQAQINKDIGKLTAISEQQAKDIAISKETAQKDRDVLILLQRNQNSYLQAQEIKDLETKAFRAEAQSNQEANKIQMQEVLKQLQAITKKLDKDL